MKKLSISFLSLFIASFSLVSCENDLEESVEMCNNDEIELISMTRDANGEMLLSFSNEMAYNSTLLSLTQMNDSALLAWGNERGFYSLFHFTNDIYDQLYQITNEDDYNALKRANSDIFIFNDTDASDYGFYLPLSDYHKAVTLSPSGRVCISGTIIDMKESGPFSFFDSGYHDADFSADGNSASIMASVSNGVNSVSSATSSRKFTGTFYKRGASKWISMYSRKKFLFGWLPYRTRFYARPVGSSTTFNFGYNLFSCEWYNNGFMNGSQYYLWTQGVGESNKAKMTISY